MDDTEHQPAAAMTPRLELTGITKAYPAVVANDGIDLRVMPGEIHAVLGENGAGKSTLMKIIYGVTKADAGRMAWNGAPVTIANPARAHHLGIGMVFQHFSLFETLTVTENIALAVENSRDLEALAARISEVSERYGLPLDPRRLVHSLSVGERQRVEIIRCLLQDPKLLIMDEPTSVLTPQAVQRLFETLRLLAEEGCSILYISHKLDEIKALCHAATILRAGKVTGFTDPRSETPSELARRMIGQDLPVCDRPEPGEGGEERLVIAGLTLPAADRFGTDLEDIQLTVHGGEIVGIAGISGNGQQELLAALSGEAASGEADRIRIDGRAVARLDAAERRDLGLVFVPEERLGRGAVPKMSLSDNALLTGHRMGMVRRGLIAFGEVRSYAEACVRDFKVSCGGIQGRGKEPVRGQSAEVHRRPRADAGTQVDHRRATDLGPGRGRRGGHTPGADRPAQRRHRGVDHFRGAGRVVRGLRPHCGDRQRPLVAGQAHRRNQRRGDRAVDERLVPGWRRGGLACGSGLSRGPSRRGSWATPRRSLPPG